MTPDKRILSRSHSLDQIRYKQIVSPRMCASDGSKPPISEGANQIIGDVKHIDSLLYKSNTQRNRLQGPFPKYIGNGAVPCSMA